MKADGQVTLLAVQWNPSKSGLNLLTKLAITDKSDTMMIVRSIDQSIDRSFILARVRNKPLIFTTVSDHTLTIHVHCAYVGTLWAYDHHNSVWATSEVERCSISKQRVSATDPYDDSPPPPDDHGTQFYQLSARQRLTSYHVASELTNGAKSLKESAQPISKLLISSMNLDRRHRLL